MHFAQLIHPDDRDENVAKVRGLRTGEAKALVFENRYVNKSGKPVWVRKIISSLPVEPGQRAQFFMLCIDINDRKQKEELLRQSEARLQLALDADGAGMWENLVESGEFFADERALALHGLPSGHPMTRDNVLAAMHPEDQPKVEQAWRHTLETGAPFMAEIRCPRPDGSVRWLYSQGKLHEIGGQVHRSCPGHLQAQGGGDRGPHQPDAAATGSRRRPPRLVVVRSGADKGVLGFALPGDLRHRRCR
jgi:PAS domain-containing protein